MTLPVEPSARVFLAEPDVQVMDLDVPLYCPVLPVVTFRRVAATPTGRHYLVIGIQRPTDPAPLLVHIGPDQTTLTRRGLLLIAGLRDHGDLGSDAAVMGLALLRWLADCWTILNEELSPAAGRIREEGSHVRVDH